MHAGSEADLDDELEEQAADITAKDVHGHDYAEDDDANDTTTIVEPVKPSKKKSHKGKRAASTTPPSSSSSSDDDINVHKHGNDGGTSEQEDNEFVVPPRRPGGKHADGSPVEPSWADDTSPFEQLRQDIQKVKIDSSYSTSSSYHAPPFAPSSIAAKKQQEEQQQKRQQQERGYKVQQTRLRDLSMDSPDFERPALQTMSFQHPRERLTQQYSQPPLMPSTQDKGKGKADPRDEFEDEESVDASGSVPDTPAGMSTLGDLSSLGGSSGGDARPGMPRRASSGNQNALLQKVLMKNLVGKDGRPNLSTPATKKLSKSISKARKSQGRDQGTGEEAGFYPTDLPSDWNGLADLSKAPLSAFESPQKRSSTRHNDFGTHRSASRSRTAHPGSALSKGGLPASISSDSLFDNSIFRDDPGTSNTAGATGEAYQPPAFSAYKSRLSRTPAKEAARLITRDVLQKASLRDGGSWEDAGMDSPPLDPPSVVKNWATRGYTTHFPPPPNSAQKQTSSTSGAGGSAQRSHLLVPLAEGDDSFEAEFDDDEAALAPPPPQPNFGHLADEGDEPVDNHAAPMGEASGTGDDWGDSFEGQSGEDDDNSGFDQPAEIVPLNDGRDAEEGDSFSDNSRSLDEETLFGANRRRDGNDPNQPGFGLHPGDNLDPESRQARLFRLQAQNDMVTLHGGNLLESQPFEASPLAGRDARYGL